MQMSSLSQRCARVCAVETHNSFFQVSQAGVHSNKRTLDRPTSAFRCADLARFCDAGPGAFRPSSLVSGIGRGKKRRFGADILLFRNHKKDLDTVTQWGNIAFFSILPWEIDHRHEPMCTRYFKVRKPGTHTICLCRYFVMKRPGGREYWRREERGEGEICQTDNTKWPNRPQKSRRMQQGRPRRRGCLARSVIISQPAAHSRAALC